MSASVELTSDAVYELIRTELVDLGVPDDQITADAKFDAMDIDSLDIADLMITIKKQYGVDIPRVELADVTIGGLAERVVRSAAS